MAAHRMHTSTRREPTERGTTSTPAAASIIGPQPVPRGYVALAILGLACASLSIYGRSLSNALVGDDWVLIEHSAGGLGSALSWNGNYHYNPVVHVLLWVLYTFFSLNPIAYHATALLFFWLGAIGIMYTAWQLSGRFAVGLIAAVLFIGHGRQYEGVIWGAVSIFQTVGLVLFLVGLISYLRYVNATLDRRNRRWAYGLFVAAVVLSPFAYEPEVVLTLVCMLYRLLVVEHQRGFGWIELQQRARDWTRDFAAPAVFLVGYLVFKAWLARTSPQTPGLHQSLAADMRTIARGLRLAFLPGLDIEGSLAHTLVSFVVGTPLDVLVAVAGLIAGALLILRGTPTQRFLLASAVLMVVSITLGLGGITSRHVLLISMPAVILWALVLADLTRYSGRLTARFADSPRVAEVLRVIPAALIVCAWMVFGTQYAFIQQDAWKATGMRADRLVVQLDGFIRAHPEADTLYLIDMPDSAPSPTGDPANIMYMFRNSPPSLIRLTYPHRFRLVAAVYVMNDSPAGVGDLIMPRQLAQLSLQPGTLLLQYRMATETMQQWSTD
jgi:hypothetical protein